MRCGVGGTWANLHPHPNPNLYPSPNPSPNPNPDPDPDPNPNPSPNQVRWAEEFGLKLVLDLHGAPGSQNGEQTAGWEDPLWTAERFDEDAAVQVVLRTRV